MYMLSYLENKCQWNIHVARELARTPSMDLSHKQIRLDECTSPCQTALTPLALSPREMNRLASISRLVNSGFDSLYISTCTGTSEARVKEIMADMKRAANDLHDMPRGRPPKKLGGNGKKRKRR
jgi:hypothetical protein